MVIISELLTLLKNAFNEMNFGLVEMVTEQLKMHYLLESLEDEKLRVVALENYEEAIIHRDSQRKIREKLEALPNVEQLKDNLLGKDEKNNTLMRSKLQYILDPDLQKDLSILGAKVDYLSASNIKEFYLDLHIILDSQRFLEVNNSEKLIPKEADIQTILELDKRANEFISSINKLESQVALFNEKVLSSTKFKSFFKFFILASRTANLISARLLAEVDDSKQNKLISSMKARTKKLKDCCSKTLKLCSETKEGIANDYIESLRKGSTFEQMRDQILRLIKLN